MEIREGIRFKDDKEHLCDITEVKNVNGQIMVYWKSASSYTTSHVDYIEGCFKREQYKLISYPYKVGDWVYCIDDTWSLNSPQITQVTDIRQGTEALIYVNNENTYLKFYIFNDCYRPCFKHEIPTNTNQVIVENMDYLIPFIDKLNEKRI